MRHEDIAEKAAKAGFEFAGVSGALDWSALGSLPLQTVTTDAMQADAIRASGTTAAVTVTD